MASFMERKTRDSKNCYTAIVRIKGYPKQSATFSRKTDAKLWAQQTESSIRDGKYFSKAEAKKHTFADLAERYIKTVLGNQSLRVHIFMLTNYVSGVRCLVNVLWMRSNQH